eukprot:scaffold309379_cov19-Tisochrysis_lutea.AAC.3
MCRSNQAFFEPATGATFKQAGLNGPGSLPIPGQPRHRQYSIWAAGESAGSPWLPQGTQLSCLSPYSRLVQV